MSVCYVPTAEEYEIAAFDRLNAARGSDRNSHIAPPGLQSPHIDGGFVHMFGAVSQFGKFGVIAIGNSRDEADQLFNRTLAVLDRETGRRNDA
jgi:hypothetical protein